MPIVGLTDKLMPAFPELGCLRKGGEAQRDASGKMLRMGADLSFLRFTSDREEVVKAFHDCYGDEPSLLTVYLPYQSLDDNWSAWKEAWSASTLLHRCDGVTCVRWYGPDGKYHEDAKPCPGGCKQVGRLRIILPELLKAGYIGFVTVLTSSLHDIMSLQGGLMAAAAASPTGLRGVPFVVWRQPERISTPMGNGKRARREKSLLKIAPSGQWVQAMLAGAEQQAFAMLEGPKGERPDVDVATGEVPLTAEDVEDGEFRATAGDEDVPAEDEAPPAETWPDPDALEGEADPVSATRVAIKRKVVALGHNFDSFCTWFAGQSAYGSVAFEEASLDSLTACEEYVDGLAAKAQKKVGAA